METARLSTDKRGVITLTLTRGDKRNALSAQMIAEVTHAAKAISRDPGARAAILAAEGDAFCAGGDLRWMQEQMAADQNTRRREATAIAMMLKALNTLPLPLIGRVHGDAYGGGVGLMSVCDTVIAAKGTKFGLTETRLGLIPATIGPYVIARIGEAAARQIFFNSRPFDVEKAKDLGLVSSIVEDGQIDDAIEREVAPLLNCAPGAVADAKSLIRTLVAPVTDVQIEKSIDALMARWGSGEAKEGTEAFFAKRAPYWGDSS